MRTRRFLGFVAAIAVVLPVCGCGLFGSEATAETAAGQFLAAFTAGDTANASQQTDSVESARAVMDTVRKSLTPDTVNAQVKQVRANGDSNATADFSMTWDLGKGRRWTYDGSFELRLAGEDWKVHWTPTVLHPKLAAQQSIAVKSEAPALAPVLDRDGGILLSPERVVSIVLDAAGAGDLNAVATTLGGALSRFDATITPESIVAGATKAAGKAYQVAVLRDSDYQQVKPQIYTLPGVRFSATIRLLPTNKALAPLLVAGVRKLVEDQVDGEAGWRVVTMNSTGTEVEDLYAKQAEPAKAVTTTLSTTFQAAAEAALAPEQTAGMIVAIKPSSGELLAVAQNPIADAQGLTALTGRYPPGSTFKIVTATAALETGRATADTPSPCPGTITLGGRVIPNNNMFDLGTVPLHQAFAASCNTTFAKLASEMEPNLLPETARKLGLGVDFTLPGITTVTGSVPPATDLVERSEDGMGQGKDVASPFGMAVVAATMASGTVPKPVLIRGTPTTIDTQPPTVSSTVLDPVRAMMREVVTSGHGGQMSVIPNSYGKTGTAQFGDGSHSHGWFVGYVGDLAFATLIVDAGTSIKAADATARFLQGVG